MKAVKRLRDSSRTVPGAEPHIIQLVHEISAYRSCASRPVQTGRAQHRDLSLSGAPAQGNQLAGRSTLMKDAIAGLKLAGILSGLDLRRTSMARSAGLTVRTQMKKNNSMKHHINLRKKTRETDKTTEQKAQDATETQGKQWKNMEKMAWGCVGEAGF